ncbi:MAG TPA: hypothetical protein VH186_09310 [Chloroflexia bacterium]|nr:hypothetical protein [Chloroflexia bacterium]
MEKVRNVVTNIDGVELRTAMLFLWVSVFCFFVFVVSLSFPGLAFADVACLLFFLITLLEGLNWVKQAILAEGRKQAAGAREVSRKAGESGSGRGTSGTRLQCGGAGGGPGCERPLWSFMLPATWKNRISSRA